MTRSPRQPTTWSSVGNGPAGGVVAPRSGMGNGLGRHRYRGADIVAKLPGVSNRFKGHGGAHPFLPGSKLARTTPAALFPARTVILLVEDLGEETGTFLRAEPWPGRTPVVISSAHLPVCRRLDPRSGGRCPGPGTARKGPEDLAQYSLFVGGDPIAAPARGLLSHGIDAAGDPGARR